ncbi:uncharacterized protein VTP21DRAFT_9803 [Calcarisporiella thermophila]|uniref:uncharacterized protein n=1 Tax=Calcarisporiella thermophila TaxID=911321 RepID=UPI0037448186
MLPTKRQRVTRACDTCRKKKVKCDGTTPVCSNCLAFGLECSYSNLSKKRGPPKGYIEAIENRLMRMEELLGDLVDKSDPRVQSVLAELSGPLETPSGEQIPVRHVRRHNTASSSDERPPGSNDRTHRAHSADVEDPFDHSPMTEHKAETISENEINRLNDMVGQLCIDELGQVRFLGKSSGLFMVKNSRTFSDGVFHFSVRSTTRKSGSKIVVKSSDEVRPYYVNPFEQIPRDLSDHLIHLYFTYIYPTFPVVHKPSFLRALYDESNPPPLLLLNAIYALASRISDDPRCRTDPEAPESAGEIFFERAKVLLDNDYDVSRLSTIQALLLLGAHQQAVCRSSRAWLYCGMAIRMALDLGLNRNCESWNLPKEEKRIRKRVFWCCFVADRFISAKFGRSLSIDEREFDVPYPNDDDEEEEDFSTPSSPATPVGSGQRGSSSPTAIRPQTVVDFKQLVRLYEILGRILQSIYSLSAKHNPAFVQNPNSLVSSLHNSLVSWYKALPQHLHLPPGTRPSQLPSPPVCLLHLLYHSAVILLHRPFIPMPDQEVPRTSYPSHRICTEAANAIVDISYSLRENGSLRFLYHPGTYCIFTAASIHLNNATSSDPKVAAKAKLDVARCMSVLSTLEDAWMSAQRACNIIGDLVGLRELQLDEMGYVKEIKPLNKQIETLPSAKTMLCSASAPPLCEISSEPATLTQSLPPNVAELINEANSVINSGSSDSSSRSRETPLSLGDIGDPLAQQQSRSYSASITPLMPPTTTPMFDMFALMQQQFPQSNFRQEQPQFTSTTIGQMQTTPTPLNDGKNSSPPQEVLQWPTGAANPGQNSFLSMLVTPPLGSLDQVPSTAPAYLDDWPAGYPGVFATQGQGQQEFKQEASSHSKLFM